MSSITSYTNKYHIRMAASQGEGWEILRGEIFYWVVEIWCGVILTTQIFFRLKIKISKTCVYTKKSKKFKTKMVQQKQCLKMKFLVLYIHLMGEGESIARIFPSGSENKFSASWGEGTPPSPLVGNALHNVLKVYTSIVLILYYL